MDSLGQVAAFAAQTATSDIPPEVTERTALILADCIGAIVGGAAEPDVAALASRQTGSGPALLIGTFETRPAGTAALLNGTAGTTLEMDEGNQFCKGHPGMHTVPAALAAANGQVSAADLLAAIAIGYDVGARVGIATQLRTAMHPHGTWGAICAATAVARLQGAQTEQMRHAISLSASLGLSTSRRTMLEGGTVRNVFAGVSGQMGVLAGDMIASGYTGDHDGVAQVFGHVVSDSFDEAAFAEGLGTRWEVSRNYFKMHSCCRYNHAALDALASLRAGPERLDHRAVESVLVETYSLAVGLDDPVPKNVLAGKFSVPFAMASALVNDSTGVDSFTMPNVTNPEILALAQRVKVVEDPALTALLPNKRPARITLTLKSGEVLQAATETNRGDWSDPYPPDEIREKYLSLTTRLWREDAAIGIWDKIMALGTAETLDDLFTDMAQAPR
ncbi:MmgE/PrpD family protein [Pseudohalocynthiibacter sp. F2068]|jgi:2-methylcitrate dehydratase PrpD|uniref:MmgE/PrpD family protein n=1 Tax=Pseudohalocynthiibacter sp. F2068 TaxID=2926418 RepID=UPI001FF1623E|nr:MmgE/PrpD family protein [Pseudohalocynthiibacter sp. F2068]MCK0100709.1 MmgE/PrpD family protein [Pseudohalocynthiibacter sp. F2068]